MSVFYVFVFGVYGRPRVTFALLLVRFRSRGAVVGRGRCCPSGYSCFGHSLVHGLGEWSGAPMTSCNDRSISV